MRRLLGLIAGSLLLAGTAHGATFSYTGSFVFGLATLPGLTATGTGVVTVNGIGALTTLQINAGDLGPVTASLPVTSSATINSVIFTGLANLSGAFSGLSGTPGGGIMGVAGVSKICLVFSSPGTCSAAVTVPLSPSGATGFGVGGTQVVPGAVAVTLQHNPWTVGQPVMSIHTPGSTVSVPTLPGGFAHGPATGGASSAAQLGGVLQLVTTSKTFTSLTGAFPELPIYGILTLNFVPEPGTLLLLVSGVGTLAILGRKRASR